MISRRTRARLDFVGNLAVLALVIVLRHTSLSQDYEQRDDGCTDCSSPTAQSDSAMQSGGAPANTLESAQTPSLRGDWVLIGVVSGVCYRLCSDRDIAGIRRSRTRRWTLVLGIWLGQAVLALDDQDTSHSFGLGSSVGAVCYRTKYGLLSSLPDR
ncbi:hypothetical protein [Natronolimnobius baerhuensis]|uniref:DUF8097 domain-containing protein n=1 Tax=Natronolimnobius baerhuensis TaxID=253108 RepID=A0A202E9R0_9EURY|nr:hypothetical protein [Natronolimnobius baerhuensis]OVE84981.1 hypothetical protein B2G88_11530 [Natronolimnobius baerhuensis]